MNEIETQVELRKQSGRARFYQFGERVARGGIVPADEIAKSITDAGLTTPEFEDFVADCKRRVELLEVLSRKSDLKARVADCENALMPLRAKAENIRVEILAILSRRDEINRILEIDHAQAKTEIEEIESRWAGKIW